MYFCRGAVLLNWIGTFTLMFLILSITVKVLRKSVNNNNDMIYIVYLYDMRRIFKGLNLHDTNEDRLLYKL